MNEFSIRVKVYNNQLRQRRLELGLTGTKLAKEIGVSVQLYCALERLKTSPLTSKGEWTAAAKKLSAYHCVSADELFPDAVQAIQGPVVVERTVSASDLEGLAFGCGHANILDMLPSEIVEISEVYGALDKALRSLSAREEIILRQRFGIGADGGGGEEMSLAEIGTGLGLTRTRIRQIEATALRKLRHPSRTRPIKAAVFGLPSRDT